MVEINSNPKPLTLSQRAVVAPFLAMDVMNTARRLATEGHSILHMEIGEPGFATPLSVRAAVMKALEHGRVGYTQALGLPELREKLAAHYKKTYHLDISPSRIALTLGSSSGFVLAFLALFDPGARVAIAAPGYPPYRAMLESLGLEVVEIETGPESRWALTGEAIARAHAETPLSGVLLMSPANPSGTVISPENLAAIAETCRRHDIRIISDEIYHGLTYGQPTETMLRFHDDAIIVHSFSKYWCMTGWRIGWLVIPEHLERPVESLAQSLFISVPYLSQIAGLAALDAHDEVEAIHGVYARNREFLLDAFPRIGLPDFLPADGGFYIYADVSRYTEDSIAFAQKMLEETGVATTPGVDFDPRRGHHYIRFSFAEGESVIREAVARLAEWLPGQLKN